MDQKTREKLTALYGGDEAGLQAFLDQFETQVDGVNRTVKDKNLVHRSTKDEPVAEAEAEDEAAAETEAEEDDGEGMTVDEVIAEVFQSREFKTMSQGIASIQKMVGELLVERENDKKEIARLSKAVGDLGKEDTERKQEYLQDLPPRNRRTVITHRPREANDPLNGGDVSMDSIANRTLNGIPAASRY